MDLQRLREISGGTWGPAATLPALSFALTGDGGNVLERATMTFASALHIKSQPWRIPTNSIHEPLLSFTAIRGFRNVLASSKAWTGLGVGEPPNQFYCWALDGVPLQICCAAPLQTAGNEVRTVTDILLKDGNPWLALHGAGSFQPLPAGDGVMWTGLPMVSPFLKSVESPAGSMVVGALVPNAESGTNTQGALYYHPTFAALLGKMVPKTNLLYFDWELTAPRLESWLYLGQSIRAAFRAPQLPLGTASMSWLHTIMARLGNSTTEVVLTGADQLTFTRRSTIGLTAPELHLLADWLESPQFPLGLYSTRTGAQK